MNHVMFHASVVAQTITSWGFSLRSLREELEYRGGFELALVELREGKTFQGQETAHESVLQYGLYMYCIRGVEKSVCDKLWSLGKGQ